MKKITIIMFLFIGFSACEKQTYTESDSYKDYTIKAIVKNNSTSETVSNVKVKLGAQDSKYNPEFDQGCPNVGTKTVNSEGEAFFTCNNYVGEPTVCLVEVYDLSGNFIESTYWYANATRRLTVFIY